MSGTYKIDGSFFPEDPIAKRWKREEVGRGGRAETIYSGFWQIELEFPTLLAASQASFFYDLWVAGGLHTAQLPHPRDGHLCGFTSVNLSSWEYEFTDVDSDDWAERPRLVLSHISMSATGAV
jgi:hypothetical protein